MKKKHEYRVPPAPSNHPIMFISHIVYTIRKRGIMHTVYWGSKILSNFSPIYYYRRLLNSGRQFTFLGNKYRYFYDHTTWKNERIVEIPLGEHMVKEFKNKNILEVGNVLSQFYRAEYDILDKYDITPGVIMEDVVDFKPKKRYDLIISISTLEHVGWEEVPKEHNKILRAIKNLRSLLAPKGIMFVTIPLGYNQDITRLLERGKLKFTKMYFFKRISADNEWRSATYAEVKDAKYGSPFPHANGLLVGILEKG